MFRVQPADPQPPGGTGVAGRQRLGRHTARADGGDDHQTAVGRSPGLGRADHHRVAANGDRGDVAAGQPPAEAQLACPAHRHIARVERHQHGWRWRWRWRWRWGGRRRRWRRRRRRRWRR